MSSQELADFIRVKAKEMGLSIVELSKRSNVSRQAIYNILNSDTSQSRLSTITQLANALKVHPMDLLRVYFNRWQFPHQISAKHKTLVPYDDIGFIGDVTYPDNSIVTTGQIFEKVWEIRNIGTKTWHNRKIVCTDQQIQVQIKDHSTRKFLHGLIPISGTEITIPTTEPGQNLSISVTFQAPEIACTTISWWKMTDENNNFLFPETPGLYCQVNVVAL